MTVRTIGRPLLVLPAAILVLLLAGHAPAAEPAVSGYADYDAFRAQLESIATSELATLESLGRTLGGREVCLLRIGTGPMDQKPAILVVGSVEPAHLAGSELAVRVARRLVDGAKKDKAVRAILDRVTFYVIPRPAPDACEAFFRRPYCERNTNERPIDDDGDGKTDEDGPDDLDGDGWITQMRVEDPAGAWMPHPDDPRVLVKADPKKNEQGRWSLYVEGVDNDGDEAFNEDPPGGVAFNRNFTLKYPYFKPGAGPHQVSEAETRAVADFAFSRSNIAAVFTFTPEDNLMRPWKPNAAAEGQKIKTTLLGADAPFMDFLAETYRKIHGAKDAPESPSVDGSFCRWAYFHYGRWSLGARAWWVPKVAAEKDKKEAKGKGEPSAKDEKKKPDPQDKKAKEEKRGADDLNALRWFARQKIDGFVPWKEVKHPDFPGRKAEVGGFRPFVRTNPPAAELDGLAEKHQRFLARLVELLPQLAIHEVKTEPLGEGAWRVTVVVLNRGYLPTASKMGQLSRQPQPLQVALDLPEGVTLLTGHPRVQLPVLAGSGGRAEQSWLLRAPKGKPLAIPLRVWSPPVGQARAEAKLGK